MNTTAETSSYEWMQFYEQTVDEVSTSSLGFSDATVMATTASPDSSTLSPTVSEPKGSSSSSKPIRRRSRASKKTPTTLLNANASNFRALVQQFTGCPRATLSLGTRRGPINLNFTVGSGSQQNSMMSSVSGNDIYHYYQQGHQENASHNYGGQQHQQFYQDGVPFDNVHHDAFFTTSSGRANADDDQMLNGFDMDHNISLQPHNDNSSNNSNYFL